MQLIEVKPEDLIANPGSKLERSKAKRRQAIVSAARELIRETGETGLSMRALAARANVSLATPYNLFGSKQGVLVALSNIEAEAFGKMFQAQASTNSLSRIFEYVDMTFSLYRSDEKYWRVMLRILYRSEDAQLRERLRKPRVRFLRALLKDAIVAGNLDSELSVDFVSRALFGIYLYTVQEWVHEQISLERARLETGFGYSLILLAEAAEHAKPELLARRNRLSAAVEDMVKTAGGNEESATPSVATKPPRNSKRASVARR